MRLKFILALSALLVAATSFAADKPVEDLLAKMRKTYQGTKTAKFETKMTVTGRNGKVVISLLFEFAQPNKMRASMQVPNAVEQTVYCNGKDVVVVDNTNGGKQTMPYSVDVLGRAIQANLESICFFDWARQLSTATGGNMKESKFKILSEKWNGKTYTVLEETAEAQNVFVRYFIDPKTNYIWRTVVQDLKTKKEMQDFEIVKLALGEAISPSRFEAPK